MTTDTKPHDKIERRVVPIGSLVPNDDNPNKMSARQFSMLVDNMRKVGFTDPIFCRPLPNGKLEVVGGHHRLEAARELGYTEVPVSVNPELTDDEASFQLMSHNMIRGKLDTEKFVKLYEKMAAKYSKEVLAEAFGFEEQAALDRLIKSTLKGLPKEMQSKFKAVSAEIKTIGDLSKVLNSLFARYGDTLKFGYMLMDFGGKDSVWVRMHGSDRKVFDALADRCRERGVTLDSVMRTLLQLAVGGENEQFEKLLKLMPKVKDHEQLGDKMLTEENLEGAGLLGPADDDSPLLG